MRSVNLGVKFLLELGAVVAFYLVGPLLLDGVAGLVVGLGCALAMVLVWGRWAAPRSDHRLRTPARIPLELGVFALATLAFVPYDPLLAAAFAGVVVVNAVLMTRWHQWAA